MGFPSKVRGLEVICPPPPRPPPRWDFGVLPILKGLGVQCCVCPAWVGRGLVWAASVPVPWLDQPRRGDAGCPGVGSGQCGGSWGCGGCPGDRSHFPQRTQGWGCRIHAAPITLGAWDRIHAAPQGPGSAAAVPGRLCMGTAPRPAWATTRRRYRSHSWPHRGPFHSGTDLKSIDTVYLFKKKKLHSFSQFLIKYHTCPGPLPKGSPSPRGSGDAGL